MEKYDPCFNCTCSPYIVNRSEECHGKCLYADALQEHENRVDKLIEKIKILEKAYNNAGEIKTAAVIRGILVATMTLFGR